MLGILIDPEVRSVTPQFVSPTPDCIGRLIGSELIEATRLDGGHVLYSGEGCMLQPGAHYSVIPTDCGLQMFAGRVLLLGIDWSSRDETSVRWAADTTRALVVFPRHPKHAEAVAEMIRRAPWCWSSADEHARVLAARRLIAQELMALSGG